MLYAQYKHALSFIQLPGLSIWAFNIPSRARAPHVTLPIPILNRYVTYSLPNNQVTGSIYLYHIYIFIQSPRNTFEAQSSSSRYTMRPQSNLLTQSRMPPICNSPHIHAKRGIPLSSPYSTILSAYKQSVQDIGSVQTLSAPPFRFIYHAAKAFA